MSDKKRTEDEIVAKASFEVILGGKKYEIKPLVLRDSREWRKKYAEATAPLFKMVNTQMDNVGEFGSIVTQMLVNMPDLVIDLFFKYAKDLNREAIEGTATDAELAIAFKEVLKVALPLAESLPKSMSRLSQ